MTPNEVVRLRQAYEQLVNENAQLRAEREQLLADAQRSRQLEEALRARKVRLPIVLTTFSKSEVPSHAPARWSVNS